MGNYESNSGFTLIEILVSIALIGIISTTIVPAIGSSVANILFIGIRDQATNTAGSLTEIIQDTIISSDVELNESKWKNIENETVYFKGNSINIEYTGCNSVDNNPSETKIKFCKEKISNGYKVKVVFFYQDGENKVILNSFATYKRG